jgi:hypothetical protein
LAAAHLNAALAYADAFAVAAAQALDAVVLTGDPEFDMRRNASLSASV